MAKVGPSRFGKEGKVWDLKGCCAIVQIMISSAPEKIISLQFQYVDEDGKLHISDVFGNTEFVGTGFCAKKVDYPNEYIACVRGWYNDLGVEEITFVTNKVTYTFSKASESDDKQWFWYNLGYLNQFGGFHGTCDSEGINSIGVYFKPHMEFKAPVTTMTASNEPDDSASTHPLIASNDEH